MIEVGNLFGKITGPILFVLEAPKSEGLVGHETSRRRRSMVGIGLER